MRAPRAERVDEVPARPAGHGGRALADPPLGREAAPHPCASRTSLWGDRQSRRAVGNPGGVKGDGTGAEGAVCTERGGRAVVKAKSLGWS